MGYECPVCGAEEADGEHLANHLAFTALVRGGDHEDFLDEHVPDWAERDPESLAPDVTPHATETDTEPVSEPQGHHGPGHDHEMPSAERTGQADLSGDAASVLEEARELTEAMHDSAVASPETPDEDDAAEGDVADEGGEVADEDGEVADEDGEAAAADSENE